MLKQAVMTERTANHNDDDDDDWKSFYDIITNYCARAIKYSPFADLTRRGERCKVTFRVSHLRHANFTSVIIY